MNEFVLYNPTKLVFGKGAVAQMVELIPSDARILLAYGGGSVKANGSYEQTLKALGNRTFVEFSGIEPNPEFETCLKAVALIKENNLNYIVALGGGSVIDGCKFIASAALYENENYWEILTTHGAHIKKALPIATVLTLPATASEMNPNAVISRRSSDEKLALATDKVFPVLSALDPTFTYTMPDRQISNGVVDTFVHIMEQYCTRPANAPIQDGFAETLLRTLIENGPKALVDKENYDVRANVMFAGTLGLNKMINVGVPEDWATHMIGHEITALYGLDHAQTLAIVMPKVLQYKKDIKLEKLAQLAKNVFGIEEKCVDCAAQKAIEAVRDFFKTMQMKTELSQYGIGNDAPAKVAANFARNNISVGENADIFAADVEKILSMVSSNNW